MDGLKMVTVPRDLYYHEVAYVRKLEAIAATARELIHGGLALKAGGLTVLENRDNSDPHYRLCALLDEMEPLNPKSAAVG